MKLHKFIKIIKIKLIQTFNSKKRLNRRLIAAKYWLESKTSLSILLLYKKNSKNKTFKFST